MQSWLHMVQRSVAQTPFLGVCDFPKGKLLALLGELEESPADGERP
jgi:hypothetical protein